MDPAAVPTAPDTGSTGGTTDTGGSTGATTGGSTGSGDAKPDTGGDTGTRYFYYESDVLVGELGQPPKRINRVPRVEPLPSRDTPVVLYMGVANEGKVAVFSVSRDVVGVTGGTCSPSPESCQLLALEKGKTAELSYAYANKVFSLKVADIRLRVTRKPPKR